LEAKRGATDISQFRSNENTNHLPATKMTSNRLRNSSYSVLLLAATVATCFLVSATAAHRGVGSSWGACRGGGGCHRRARFRDDGHNYHWRRRAEQYHNRGHHHHRASPLDFLADILSTPVYDTSSNDNPNSLMRQSEESRLRRAQQSSPQFDIQELEDSYELTMEVPGMDAKDLSVELEDNDLLRVSGSRQFTSGGGQVVETKFDQTFSLEDVDTEHVKVTLSNGLLKISAPKKVTQVTRLVIQQEQPTEELLVKKTVMGKTIHSVKESGNRGDEPVAGEVDAGLSISKEETM
jgi:HSP20 family molecular chaperone IbpA